MISSHSRTPRRRLALSAIGLGIATATILAGCTSADGDGEDAAASEVPYGASAADYQAALADMDAVTLVVQSGSASESVVDAQPLIAMLERIEEYSGGKITFETTWASGIVSNNLELDDALIDGRIDITNFFPQYDPAEYPANNAVVTSTVLRDPSFVTGWYAGQAAMQEVALTTPELMAEWEGKGIIPLNSMSPDGPTVLICREAWTSLDELAGKQVRVGGTVHSQQIEGIGAVPVSLQNTEVYEALQRGILDCSLTGHKLATMYGHLEVAPYIIHTDTVSFASTPTNFYAGPRVGSLPPAAVQLIVESAQTMTGGLFEARIHDIIAETVPMVVDNDGEWLAFGPDTEARLAETNDEILAELAESTVLDGADLADRVRTATAKWVALVNELGYTDDGPMSTMPDWFVEPTPYDAQPWIDAVVSEILAVHGPV